MAAVDLAGFVTDLKEHAVEHGFHIHDERHFVETYSLRQAWEVDLHPSEACGGPLDLHMALEAEPRVLLSFEDAVLALDDGDLPEDLVRARLVRNLVLLAAFAVAIAATTASKALPPERRISAAVLAVSGCPAATPAVAVIARSIELVCLQAGLRIHSCAQHAVKPKPNQCRTTSS